MTEVSFNLKKCPMCGNSLAVRLPPAGSSDHTKRYLCSTHIPNTKISHYHIAIKNGSQLQVVQAPPYSILNWLHEDHSSIYTFRNNEQEWIMDLPRISLENTDSIRLGERIKLFILFS